MSRRKQAKPQHVELDHNMYLSENVGMFPLVISFRKCTSYVGSWSFIFYPKDSENNA